MFNTLIHLDTYLFTIINSHHTIFFDRLFQIITQLGSGWVAIPIVAIFIVLKTPKKILARALLCAAVAGSVSGIINTQIKHAVNRDRPVVYFAQHDTSAPSDSEKIHIVGKVLKRHSFPSGHANTAFTAAAILALLFGGYFHGAWLVAFLVAFSRVYVGAHFPLDTLAGGLFGALVALIVIRLFQWKKLLPGTILKGHTHDKQ